MVPGKRARDLILSLTKKNEGAHSGILRVPQIVIVEMCTISLCLQALQYGSKGIRPIMAMKT